MARIKEHVKDCERVLGKPHKEVHEFLDHCAMIFPTQMFGEYHRSFFHNRYGVETVRGWWGMEAEKAAKIHIVRDYCELPTKDWEMVKRLFGKALIHFNCMDNFEPNIHPDIVKGWGNKSLVLIATE